MSVNSVRLRTPSANTGGTFYSSDYDLSFNDDTLRREDESRKTTSQKVLPSLYISPRSDDYENIFSKSNDSSRNTAFAPQLLPSPADHVTTTSPCHVTAVTPPPCKVPDVTPFSSHMTVIAPSPCNVISTTPCKVTYLVPLTLSPVNRVDVADDDSRQLDGSGFHTNATGGIDAIDIRCSDARKVNTDEALVHSDQLNQKERKSNSNCDDRDDVDANCGGPQITASAKCYLDDINIDKRRSPIRRRIENDRDDLDGCDSRRRFISNYEKYDADLRNGCSSSPDRNSASTAGQWNRNVAPNSSDSNLPTSTTFCEDDIVSKKSTDDRYFCNDDKIAAEISMKRNVDTGTPPVVVSSWRKAKYSPSSDHHSNYSSPPSHSSFYRNGSTRELRGSDVPFRASPYGSAEKYESSPYGSDQYGSAEKLGLELDPLAAMLRRFSVPTGSGNVGGGSGGLTSSTAGYSLPCVARSSLSYDMMHRQGHREKDDMLPFGSTSFNIGLEYDGGLKSLLPVGTGLTNDHQFYCHICSFVGTSEENFKEHLKCHFEHQCPHCTYSSRTEGRLKRHISDFHIDKFHDHNNSSAVRKISGVVGKPKLLKCRQCKYSTMIKEEFWSHSRVHIKKEKQLSCPRCEFVTEFKHHLEYHIRNHVGSKPYKCSKCTYMCVNKSMLNSHLKSHTNVYRYRCASCSYATKYAHSLKIHLRKKKHTAAVVLNEDGSLPTDGMGNFDLLSKRGPPKGSRVSKLTVEPSAGSTGSSPMQSGISPDIYTRHQSGMLVSETSPWPHPQEFQRFSVASNDAQSQNSDIRATTRDDFAQTFSSASPYKVNPLANSDLPISLLNSVFLPPRPAVLPPSLSSPMRCKLCRLMCDSLSHLSQHFMQEHTSEGHEILASFGIKPEMLASLTWPSLNLKQELRMLAEQNRSVTLPPFLSTFSDAEKIQNGRPSVDAGAEPDSGSQIFIKEHPSSFFTETKLDFPVKKEIPLDLSSKQECDKENGQKRMLENDEDDDDEIMSHSLLATDLPAAATSEFIRRRSRKGKAFKLDVQNLKFYENWEEEEHDDGKCDSSKKIAVALNDETEKIRENGKLVTDQQAYPNSVLDIEKTSDTQKNSSEKLDAPEIRSKMASIMQSDSAGDILLKPADVRSSKAGNGFYMCQHCEMGFRDRVTHSIHMGYHGFSDPFRCNMCGHRSSDRVEFFLHMARVAHE